MTSAQAARIRVLIARKEAQLVTVNANYTKTVSPMEKYSFSSGGASQSVSRRAIVEISKEQSRLEQEIEALYRQLEGGTLANLNLRRH